MHTDMEREKNERFVAIEERDTCVVGSDVSDSQ